MRGGLSAPDKSGIVPYIGGMTSVPGLVQMARRLVAVLLLLVVVTHAAAPFAQTFERSAGSAFSAATTDVTLACGQAPAVAKRILPASPAFPVIAPTERLAAAPAQAACRPEMAGLGQTGPPPSRTTFLPLAPRAPPAV